MAQASQCSQFLPSKDEEQSSAMYGCVLQKQINSEFLEDQMKLSNHKLDWYAGV